MLRRCSSSTLVLVFSLALGSPASAATPPDPVPTYVTQWGGTGTDPGQLGDPQGIAVDADGNIYVTEFANSRVSKFNNNREFLLSWGGVGTSEGKLIFPGGIAVGKGGQIYVADSANDRIQVFTPSGDFVRMWGWGVDDGSAEFQKCTTGCQAGINGSGDGQFKSPQGVAIEHISGQVYVTDTFNNRVQYFSNAGTFLGKWGSLGSAAGRFTSPAGLAVDPEANVLVADQSNERIQKFTSDGGFMEAWGWGVADGTAEFQVCTSGCQAGLQGSGDGQFNRPLGITVDDVGRVWVADTQNDRVQLLDASGGFGTRWGATGTGDGLFDTVTGVAVTSRGNIYVADSGNDRIQLFRMAKTKVSIKAPDQADRGMRITVRGKVTSPQVGCVARQSVVLTGNGRVIGADTTSLSGAYAIPMKVRHKITVRATYDSHEACASSRSVRRAIRT